MQQLKLIPNSVSRITLLFTEHSKRDPLKVTTIFFLEEETTRSHGLSRSQEALHYANALNI